MGVLDTATPWDPSPAHPARPSIKASSLHAAPWPVAGDDVATALAAAHLSGRLADLGTCGQVLTSLPAQAPVQREDFSLCRCVMAMHSTMDSRGLTPHRARAPTPSPPPLALPRGGASLPQMAACEDVGPTSPTSPPHTSHHTTLASHHHHTVHMAEVRPRRAPGRRPATTLRRSWDRGP